MLDASILQSLRVMDEQDHLQRYEWFNLPEGVDANLLERILYYRGRGALFYLEGLDKFYFLPFALDGSIDPYARYERITPLAFNGSMDSKKDKFFIPGKSFEVLYDILPPNELTYEKFVGTAVILNDYSQQISQTVLPRARLQEPILQTMAELIPFCRTSLLNSTGISGVYVSSKDEAQSVLEASRAINQAALMGDKWIPITAGLDPKPLTS